MDRILEGEPWTFDKHLVVMSQYENGSTLQDIKFERTKLWVQLHGIPIKYMTVEAAKKIGRVLGEVFAPTNPKLFDGGHFIRIQVSIDLSCAAVDWCLLVKEGSRYGYRLSMKDCLTCATSVDDLLMMIETVTCGLIARALSNQNNMSLDHI